MSDDNPGMNHPKFLAQQFKPGQSGNPKGRPRRKSFEVIVREILDESIPKLDAEGKETGDHITKRELLARAFVNSMLKRNAQLIKEFLAREWPAVEKHELSGNIGVASPEDLDSLEARLDLIAREIEEERASGEPGSGGNSGTH
jgi:hypothetical protein